MNFTASQQAAINTESRETLVIAGAGSGKTSILVHRIAKLIERGASPSEMLVLTFTRKAAGEIGARLNEMGVHMTGAMMGTFHSVALSILRTDGDRLGYDLDTLTVIEQVHAEMLLMQLCRELGYLVGEKTWKSGLSKKGVKAALEAYYTSKFRRDASDAHAQIIFNYQSRLRSFNVLDYGAILERCAYLLQMHPDIPARYHARIQHVLVDEIQDTNMIQHDILDMLQGDDCTFFGVGDRRQSIYGFRGARPDLMTTRHPEAEIINACECFRCGERIITVANALIDHDNDPFAVPMISMTQRPGPVAIEYGRSMDVVTRVRGLRDVGFGWSDIAIIARNHRTLKRLDWVFREADIPVYPIGVRFDITNTTEFRTLHAAMTLVANPRDDIAFLRLIDALHLNQHDYALIQEAAAREGKSHFECCPQSPLVDMIRKLSAEDILSTVVVSLGNLLRAITYSEKFWLEYVFVCGDASMTLRQALDWFALRDSHDDVVEGDHVTLLTCHAAKGLEWPAVVLVGWNEGEWPSSQSIRAGEVDEERRLAYVGITRAKEHLSIFYRRKKDQSPGRKISKPSRFLSECGLLEASHA